MNSIRVILLLCTSSLFAGCSANMVAAMSPHIDAMPETKEEVMKATKIENSEFEKTTSIAGPRGQCNNNFTSTKSGTESGYYCQVRLTAAIQGKTATVMAIVEWVGPDWLFLERATVRGGEERMVRQLDRRVKTHTVAEFVGIVVPPSDMEAGKTEGITYRVSGTRGYDIVVIPPHYVFGFMSIFENNFSDVSIIGPSLDN